ncbi:beta-ketoacyl synthase N-terminal-like domain-containing protein [Paraliomyxa miuraensis]|uniref:beta-ketoacyl synthase N-terminal-like domain-containing protein n=1 Tax=Paraliomyxa miuraensis TaxID=376150 RepID=UPI0022507C3F|nr:beta-ketoacyl synthase N-terminal-like domain-containing protein [Paraliomyxa miuraensis]MCX4240340.1 hypothetical protein [Paraliomyxa miuraensis]
MSTNVISIVGAGLSCPLGLRLDQAISAIDAGIVRFADVPAASPGPRPDASSSTTTKLQRVKASILEDPDPGRTRTERALFFARHALAEAVTGLRRLFTTKPVPCLLAVPEAIGPSTPDLAAIKRALATVAADVGGLQLSLRSTWMFSEGRAGVFQALEVAMPLLGAGYCDLTVVGGLDSLVAPDVLTALVELERVRSDRAHDGIVPGEGAAFLVLAHPRVLAAESTLATLHAVAVAEEPRPVLDPRPRQAEGLTSVFLQLREQLGTRVDEVISAQTGQGFYGRQLAHAHLRNTTLMPDPLELCELGPRLGDVGAAAGSIALACAVGRMRPPIFVNRAQPPRSALAYGMSEHGAVGGCVVTPAQPSP